MCWFYHIFFLTKSSFKKISKAHLRLPTAAIMWPSLVAQTVKHLPTMRETQVQSLGQEDLEKEMATHSSILAWKVPWIKEPRRLGVTKSRTRLRVFIFIYSSLATAYHVNGRNSGVSLTELRPGSDTFLSTCGQAQALLLFPHLQNGDNIIYLMDASQMALVVKNPPTNAGDIRDVGSVLGFGISPGEGNGNPLHYSCLGNSMDRGAWGASLIYTFKKKFKS